MEKIRKREREQNDQVCSLVFKNQNIGRRTKTKQEDHSRTRPGVN